MSAASSVDAALYPPPHAGTTPQRRGGLVAFVLGGSVVGGIVGALAARGGLDVRGFAPGLVVGFGLGLVLGLWPNIVLHELGHALAGWLRGFRLLVFGVGPLRLERTHGGRLRWRWAGGVRGIGGFAAMLPPAGRGGRRADMVVFGLGGPGFNLVTAAGLYWLGTVPGLPGGVQGACFGLACGALLLGLVNLLPFHTQGWRSDGLGVLDLLRGTPDAMLQLQVNALSALSLAGVRPRDWPAEHLPAAEPDSSSPVLALAAQAMRLAWACDRHDAQAAFEAAAVLAHDFDRSPDGLRTHLAVALAGHAAVLRRDPALLAAWRPHCEGAALADLTPYHRWLDAEHAALTGNTADARAQLAAAGDALDRIGDPASRQLVEEHLQALRQRLEAPDAAVVKDA